MANIVVQMEGLCRYHSTSHAVVKAHIQSSLYCTSFPNLQNWTQECNVFNDPTIVYTVLEYLDKQSNVMGGPRKIRSRGSWSHIVSKATDA